MKRTFPLTTLSSLAAAAGLAFSLAAPSVLAQSPAEKKIDEIEKQLQALKQTVDDLRRRPPANPSALDAPPALNEFITNRVEPSSSSRRLNTNDPIARIRDEGLNHSEVMQTLSYLSDVIGPRLTGSPNLKRANEWTRDKLASWGLTNAHLEAWGPFGRGWSLKRFSAQVIEPQTIPLIGCPNAWSPGLEKPLVAEVVFFDARTNSDLEKFKGKLEGAIVLSGATREIRPVFEPMAVRLVETNSLQLANAGDRSTAFQSGAAGSS